MSAPANGMSQSKSENDEKKEEQDSSHIKTDGLKNDLAKSIKEKQIIQRKCNKYTPKENGTDCQCGRNKKWHEKEKLNLDDPDTKKPWTMETHTLQSPCGSYGEIKFKENGTRNSAYIRVDPETDVLSLWTIMSEQWKLPIPKLLISVTGGAKRFNLSPKHQLNFKKSLMNAATIKDAWIITGGMGTGVVKLVGEAIRDPFLTNGATDMNFVALGIATWGCVANRKKLHGDKGGLWPATYKSAQLGNRKETADEPEAPLDPNHTHFILVDDGSIKKSDVESSLRDRLEQLILDTHGNNLAVLKIMVGGGNDTVKSVMQLVTKNIPVLILKGSGGAADFIAFGYNMSKCKDDEEKYNFPDDFDQKLKDEAEFVFGLKQNSDENKIQEIIENMKNILKKNRKMINVFDLNETGAKDIDRAILDVLLKANKSNASVYLTLALACNTSEIARNEILGPRNEEQWKTICLENYMFAALVQDRVDFVQLFLDCGVSFTKFLTIKRLSELYKHGSRTEFCYRRIEMCQTKKERNNKVFWGCICCRNQENADAEEQENAENAVELKMLDSVGKFIAHLLRDESMNPFSAWAHVLHRPNGKVYYLNTGIQFQAKEKDTAAMVCVLVEDEHNLVPLSFHPEEPVVWTAIVQSDK